MLYLVYAFAIFVGGVIQSSLGLGFLIFSLPIITLTTPPKVAVPFLLTLATFNTFIVTYKSRADIQVDRIWPLIPAGILGIPFGTIILLKANGYLIKIFIGITTILFAITITKLRKTITREKAGLVPAGFTSGVLQGSIGMSGPPVILFFQNQGMGKNPFRANLIFFFLILNIVTLVGYSLTGLLTKDVLFLSVLYLPVLIAGTIVGIMLFKKINEKIFKKTTLILLVFLGILAIVSGMKVI